MFPHLRGLAWDLIRILAALAAGIALLILGAGLITGRWPRHDDDEHDVSGGWPRDDGGDQ